MENRKNDTTARERGVSTKTMKENGSGMNRRELISYAALAAMAGLSTVVLASCGGGGGSGGGISSTSNGALSSSQIMRLLQPILNERIGTYLPQYPEYSNYRFGDLFVSKVPQRRRARIGCIDRSYSIPGNVVLKILDEVELISGAHTFLKIMAAVGLVFTCTFTAPVCIAVISVAAGIILGMILEGIVFDKMRKYMGGGLNITLSYCITPGFGMGGISIVPGPTTLIPLSEEQEVSIADGSIMTVAVPAASRWTHTGVTLLIGQPLKITASGTAWYTNTENCGPNGRPGILGDNTFLLPGANAQSLIAKVRNKIFFVGESWGRKKSPASGELYLGMNEKDCSYCWDDNHGEWSAKIELSRYEYVS